MPEKVREGTVPGTTHRGCMAKALQEEQKPLMEGHPKPWWPSKKESRSKIAQTPPLPVSCRGLPLANLD